jgi:hypothetical protein
MIGGPPTLGKAHGDAVEGAHLTVSEAVDLHGIAGTGGDFGRAEKGDSAASMTTSSVQGAGATPNNHHWFAEMTPSTRLNVPWLTRVPRGCSDPAHAQGDDQR